MTSSNSVWHILEYAQDTSEQQSVRDAYIAQEDRFLPDLSAGFRVQDHSRRTVPVPSYLYVNDAMRAEQLSAPVPAQQDWFVLQDAHAYGRASHLDTPSTRTVRTTTDGLPLGTVEPENSDIAGYYFKPGPPGGGMKPSEKLDAVKIEQFLQGLNETSKNTAGEEGGSGVEQVPKSQNIYMKYVFGEGIKDSTAAMIDFQQFIPDEEQRQQFVKELADAETTKERASIFRSVDGTKSAKMISEIWGIDISVDYDNLTLQAVNELNAKLPFQYLFPNDDRLQEFMNFLNRHDQDQFLAEFMRDNIRNESDFKETNQMIWKVVDEVRLYMYENTPEGYQQEMIRSQLQAGSNVIQENDEVLDVPPVNMKEIAVELFQREDARGVNAWINAASEIEKRVSANQSSYADVVMQVFLNRESNPDFAQYMQNYLVNSTGKDFEVIVAESFAPGFFDSLEKLSILKSRQVMDGINTAINRFAPLPQSWGGAYLAITGIGSHPLQKDKDQVPTELRRVGKHVLYEIMTRPVNGKPWITTPVAQLLLKKYWSLNDEYRKVNELTEEVKELILYAYPEHKLAPVVISESQAAMNAAIASIDIHTTDGLNLYTTLMKRLINSYSVASNVNRYFGNSGEEVYLTYASVSVIDAYVSKVVNALRRRTMNSEAATQAFNDIFYLYSSVFPTKTKAMKTLLSSLTLDDNSDQVNSFLDQVVNMIQGPMYDTAKTKQLLRKFETLQSQNSRMTQIPIVTLEYTLPGEMDIDISGITPSSITQKIFKGIESTDYSDSKYDTALWGGVKTVGRALFSAASYKMMTRLGFGVGALYASKKAFEALLHRASIAQEDFARIDNRPMENMRRITDLSQIYSNTLNSDSLSGLVSNVVMDTVKGATNLVVQTPISAADAMFYGRIEKSAYVLHYVVDSAIAVAQADWDIFTIVAQAANYALETATYWSTQHPYEFIATLTGVLVASEFQSIVSMSSNKKNSVESSLQVIAQYLADRGRLLTDMTVQAATVTKDTMKAVTREVALDRLEESTARTLGIQSLKWVNTIADGTVSTVSGMIDRLNATDLIKDFESDMKEGNTDNIDWNQMKELVNIPVTRNRNVAAQQYSQGAVKLGVELVEKLNGGNVLRTKRTREPIAKQAFAEILLLAQNGPFKEYFKYSPARAIGMMFQKNPTLFLSLGALLRITEAQVSYSSLNPLGYIYEGPNVQMRKNVNDAVNTVFDDPVKLGKMFLDMVQKIGGIDDQLSELRKGVFSSSLKEIEYKPA